MSTVLFMIGGKISIILDPQFSKLQLAFMPLKGPIQAISAVETMIMNCVKRRKIYKDSIDVTKAVDHVSHVNLLNILFKRGVERCLRVLFNYFEQIAVTLLDPLERSISKKTCQTRIFYRPSCSIGLLKRRVRQGFFYRPSSIRD